MARKATIKKDKEEKLETILFNCRNHLRGKAAMTDKRDMLLTLVFIKFLYDKFKEQKEKVRRELEAKKFPESMIEMQLENAASYQKDGVFFLQPEYRWDKLIIADNLALALDNAINAIDSSDKKLKNALPKQIFTKTDLEAGTLKTVVDEVNKIDPEKYQEADLIGRVYEYFLQAFSVNADKEEGEFYTPQSVVELIASLIEPFDGTIYDPCCGSGGMFVQSAKLIAAHGGNTKTINVYGQESEPATYRLAKMNLAIRGISFDLGDRATSTFSNDMHKGRKMDYIMANPPFNLKGWQTGCEHVDEDVRWADYGCPPAANANYAWILHILDKLNVNKGIAGFLLANGALDDSDTREIRKKLIDNDKVEAIIVLPRQMFYSTDISVTLWILNNNKKGGLRNGRMLRNREGEVLFIDLRTWNENIYEKKYVKLSEEQIQKVCDIYQRWQNLDNGYCIGSPEACKEYFSQRGWYAEPELYYAAKKTEIAEKNYSLVPSRYIEFVDRDTEIDYESALQQMSQDFKALNKRWEDNKKTMIDAFKVLGYEAK